MFGLDKQVNSGSLRFIVIDGSTVQEPGATGTTYRLHIAIDLINLTLRQVEVTTDKVGESLDHYVLEEGDVVLLDRGYNQPKSLMPFLDRGGDIVLRYNAHSMNLYEKAEDNDQRMIKIDWTRRLLEQGKQPGHHSTYLCHKGKRVEVFLHAIPLPPEKAAEARRRVKQNSKKKGHKVKAETLYLSEWVLVVTSVPPELLSTQTVSDLYRVRWQVELLIKRMKSLLAIAELRAHKGTQLAELYLHGKLLYVAVTEKITSRRFASVRRRMDGPRQLTDWRLWRTVSDDLRADLKACFPAQERFTADCIRSLSERPRKRKWQTLPEPVLELIRTCRKLGVSLV